jgi:hypothetical protein
MVDHAKTGFIFPSGNAEALAGHMAALLANDDRRKALGADARRWGMKMWSLDTMVGRLLQTYELAQRRYPYKEPASRRLQSGVSGKERIEIIGDLFNRLFAEPVSNPDVTVDYFAWNWLYNSLPADYLLPDQPFLTSLLT